jgi:hypothetical protein
MKVNAFNAEIIAQEFGWCRQLLLLRSKISFGQFEPHEAKIVALLLFSIRKTGTRYTDLIQKYQIKIAKRLSLMLDFFSI